MTKEYIIIEEMIEREHQRAQKERLRIKNLSDESLLKEFDSARKDSDEAKAE